MNNDFIVICARSTRKKDLLAITNENSINSKVDYSGRYPRKYYEASVKFIDDLTDSSLVDLAIAELKSKTFANIYSKYICRD